MRRLISALFVMLPLTAAVAATPQTDYGPPGGDLSAAAADNRVAEWAEQQLSQGLTPPKAADSVEPDHTSAAQTAPGPPSDAQVQAQAQTAAQPVSPDAKNSIASVKASNSAPTGTAVITELNGVNVVGQRDALQATDQRLKRTITTLPALGAGGRLIDETPLAFTVGKKLVLGATRQLLFQQPRVRGEATDEALYQSQTGVCTPDAPSRCLASDKRP